VKTHPKKRIDIVVEAPVAMRLLDTLDDLSVSGYTVVPALAGRGCDGTWQCDGLVSDAGRMVHVFCSLDAGREDAVLEREFKLVTCQIGIVTVSDVAVVRSEHF
jgi:hypothetical protein